MSKIFCCPSKNLIKKERIESICNNIYEFCMNEKLYELIKHFDNNFKKFSNKDSIIDIVNNLCDFSIKWDYRSKQNVLLDSGERARWLLDNDKYVDKYENEIIELAKELGFIGKIELTNIDDMKYILVLGGARESNILRPQYSRMIIEKYNLYDANIVLLSCDRPIEESEKTKEFYYPDNIKTEFDAMRYGFSLTYGVEYKNDLINDRIYEENVIINNKTIKSYMLNCPSSDVTRRANSKDTYDFFFKKVYEGKGNIVLISSQLFAPYQGMKFMSLALEKNLEFDIVAYPYIMYDKTGNYKHAKAVKYLQEIRGTLLSIKEFCDNYKVI